MRFFVYNKLLLAFFIIFYSKAQGAVPTAEEEFSRVIKMVRKLPDATIEGYTWLKNIQKIEVTYTLRNKEMSSAFNRRHSNCFPVANFNYNPLGSPGFYINSPKYHLSWKVTVEDRVEGKTGKITAIKPVAHIKSNEETFTDIKPSSLPLPSLLHGKIETEELISKGTRSTWHYPAEIGIPYAYETRSFSSKTYKATLSQATFFILLDPLFIERKAGETWLKAIRLEDVRLTASYQFNLSPSRTPSLVGFPEIKLLSSPASTSPFIWLTPLQVCHIGDHGFKSGMFLQNPAKARHMLEKLPEREWDRTLTRARADNTMLEAAASTNVYPLQIPDSLRALLPSPSPHRASLSLLSAVEEKSPEAVPEISSGPRSSLRKTSQVSNTYKKNVSFFIEEEKSSREEKGEDSSETPSFPSE